MPMSDEEFGAFLEQTMDELIAKQEALRERLNIGSYDNWWFDQANEKLQFKDAEGRVQLEATVIDIGSYSPKAGTWRWAWANESVLPALRAKAECLKELEATTGSPGFGGETMEADESFAWEVAAVAVHHLAALGCYRMQSKTGLLTFLALMEVRRVS